MGKNEMKHGDNVKQSDSMQTERRNAALSLNDVLAYLTATQTKPKPESQNLRPQTSKEK